MNNNNEDTQQALLQQIEVMMGQKMKTPKDFTQLSNRIFQRLHINISSTTLKRVWGYLDESVQTRLSTLSILASFIGYRDWEHFCQERDVNPTIQSNLIMANCVDANDLSIGQCVRLYWLPDRECCLRYEGEQLFTVVESKNAKINCGDTLECPYFIEGEPLYANNLRQGNNPPMAYVAGKKDGIRVEVEKR